MTLTSKELLDLFCIARWAHDSAMVAYYASDNKFHQDRAFEDFEELEERVHQIRAALNHRRALAEQEALAS